MFIEGLVAGLNEGQSFSRESVVFGCVGDCFIGGSVSLVEVVIVDIRVRVGSCNEDACNEKSNSCDRAAQFRKACSCGMNGCHVEKASFVSSERPEMWLSLVASLSSSNLTSPMVSKPEITRSHSDRVGCECVKFFSISLKSVWFQGLFSLVRTFSSQLLSSSSSEK